MLDCVWPCQHLHGGPSRRPHSEVATPSVRLVDDMRARFGHRRRQCRDLDRLPSSLPVSLLLLARSPTIVVVARCVLFARVASARRPSASERAASTCTSPAPGDQLSSARRRVYFSDDFVPCDRDCRSSRRDAEAIHPPVARTSPSEPLYGRRSAASAAPLRTLEPPPWKMRPHRCR